MKSIFYTLTLVFVLTAAAATGGGSACAQTPFKQAPLVLPGGEFHMPPFMPAWPKGSKLSLLAGLMTRKDSVRTMPPDRMACRVPDLRYVERMPVRILKNSQPVDAMPTQRFKP